MALGIIPARGDWEYRRSAVSTLAGAAFGLGDLVKLDKSRSVSIFSSVASGYLGVAMGSSANSFPAGFVIVAIPRPGCTAYCDVATTEVSSGLSLGQVGSIATAGGRTSTWSGALSQSFTSNMCEIVGALDSTQSRIEIAFLPATSIFYSASSITLNN